MNKVFYEWWMNGGYEKWAKALDAEGGTLKALEMVFIAGANSQTNPTDS